MIAIASCAERPARNRAGDALPHGQPAVGVVGHEHRADAAEEARHVDHQEEGQEEERGDGEQHGERVPGNAEYRGNRVGYRLGELVRAVLGVPGRARVAEEGELVGLPQLGDEVGQVVQEIAQGADERYEEDE